MLDSGAIHSVIPAALLEALGVKPNGRADLRLADGSRVSRRKGTVESRLGGRFGGSDVLFGERDDATVLGLLTLNALGLWLDPLKREIKEFPMMLAGCQRPAA